MSFLQSSCFRERGWNFRWVWVPFSRWIISPKLNTTITCRLTLHTYADDMNNSADNVIMCALVSDKKVSISYFLYIVWLLIILRVKGFQDMCCFSEWFFRLEIESIWVERVAHWLQSLQGGDEDRKSTFTSLEQHTSTEHSLHQNWQIPSDASDRYD